MQVVKETLILVIFIFFVSCKSKINHIKKDENYIIQKFKSIDGYSHLTLRTFEFDNKKERFPATYQINGIIFSNSDIKDFSPPILNGKYSIRVGAISKQWFQLDNINIKKSDSLVIKIFLKNDLTPLE
jgi:hypothetical protein